MNTLAETLRMMNDPPRYFDYSGDAPHRIARAEAEAMQLAALRARFSALRGVLPVLKAAADEQGITDIADLDAGANLLFPHTVYKSYPVSLLERNRFDQMTKWLSRLTTTDLSQVDVSACDGIDSWLSALEAQADIKVVHSSGTSGTMTFLPRTREHYRIVSDTFGMSSRDFNGILHRPDLATDPWHCFYLGFKGGRSNAGWAAQWLIDNFAGSRAHFYPLYDIEMSSDVMFTAARVRKAEARGETLRMALSPALQARQAEFETIQKNAAQAMERIFEKLLSMKGEKIYLGGMNGTVSELSRRGLERGYRHAFGEGAIVQCGGGNKGAKLAENWEQLIHDFTGVSRIGQYYGMTEVTMITSKCSEGHYHVPPWVIVYVLDPETGRLQPRQGKQTGRACFFDLVPQSYWGGMATGDEITADWSLCKCGRQSVHLHGQVQRLSEARGGDDKITCAAAEDAHAAAIDFLADMASA